MKTGAGTVKLQIAAEGYKGALLIEAGVVDCTVAKVCGSAAITIENGDQMFQSLVLSGDVTIGGNRHGYKTIDFKNHVFTWVGGNLMVSSHTWKNFKAMIHKGRHCRYGQRQGCLLQSRKYLDGWSRNAGRHPHPADTGGFAGL